MTTASIICAGCKHSYAESALFCPNCGRAKVRGGEGDVLVGKVLGERFLVQEQIGQGGSGTIYRAEHVTLRRKVAIKVLHTELSRDDLAVERFRREATTVAEIDNEHIVEIHDFGRTPDGRLYLAMELLEGESLEAVLAREHQLSVERTADILIQVGEALMEAHAIGYVHRDLRPRNVYLAMRRGKANFVKLLDFGLAKLVETDAQAASTSLGMTFGDPRYMSPEQARGDRIDRRADIYQLGCVAYEMLTGSPPFTGSRVFDILSKQVTEIPTPLPTRRPGVPLWMEAAVAKMLAKDPENRFATTTRMVEALRRGLETGEVMEDEIARRRESIPPPSVSRVMQKMGLSAPTDTPRELPRPDVAAAAPAPAHGAAPASAPAASPGLPPYAPASPYGVSPHAPGSPHGPPAMPAAAPQAHAQARVQPDVHVEAPQRRRTGTPQVGVPVASPPVAKSGDVQPPITGLIEAPSGRAKRTSQGPSDEPGISQAWYDDGERAAHGEGDGDGEERAVRAVVRIKSPSTTDMSLYDEPPPRKRWPLVAGVLGLLAVGGVISFAMTRGGGDKPKARQGEPPAAVATGATPDAAPSTIISTELPDAAPAAPAVVAKADPKDGKDPKKDGTSVATPRPTETHKAATTDSHSHDHDRGGGLDFGFGTPDTSTTKHPAGTGATGTGTTTTTTTPTPTGTGSHKSGVSGADGPVDPYGGGGEVTDPGDGAAPDKKAEFYANLGSQQLASNDLTGAAASFKKATELDAKNVNAVTGLGEIALRQGLFGDAIAHLKKAARMAPKSSRVFTLLGEAYLNSGQNAVAAENFKKALQLDPDNARAREGYNEASSRVPPPDDEP